MRDPFTGVPQLPWTRHHAVRGYLDLVEETLDGDVRWTLNVSGALIDQLVHYASGGSDPQLDLLSRPWDSWTPIERRELTRFAAMGPPSLTRSVSALRARADAGEVLGGRDVRDLAVGAALGWMGRAARRLEPEVDRIGEPPYDDRAQTWVVGAQKRLLKHLVGRMAQLGATGVGLAASPHDHPILPLLIDTASARRALPDVPDVGYRRPEDALRALVRGRATASNAMGRDVRGCWPSEGAISPEASELIGAAGFKWWVSCGEVAAKSRFAGTAFGRPAAAPGGVAGFFRNQGASNWLSFDAVRLSPSDAIDGLVARMHAGHDVVALDGENPWEGYDDAGAGLRDALRERFAGQLDTFDERVAAGMVGEVTHLHTGSWIRGDLSVWYGHVDDRVVWTALRAVRDAIEGAGDEAMGHMDAALASDHTWWAGEDHDTPFFEDFMTRLRARLSAACAAAGVAVPREAQVSLSRRLA